MRYLVVLVLILAFAGGAVFFLTNRDARTPENGAPGGPSSGGGAPPDATQAPASFEPPADPSRLAPATVSLKGFAFSPATLTVRKGTTVVWTNEDAASHTVTADGRVFGSALLGQGATFRFTFNAAGTFPYHCTPHPFMQAKVVVTE